MRTDQIETVDGVPRLTSDAIEVSALEGFIARGMNAQRAVELELSKQNDDLPSAAGVMARVAQLEGMAEHVADVERRVLTNITQEIAGTIGDVAGRCQAAELKVQELGELVTPFEKRVAQLEDDRSEDLLVMGDINTRLEEMEKASGTTPAPARKRSRKSE